MAEVFAGSSMGSHGFQKPVAIKRLLPELATDYVFVERLIGEAKLLVGMQHGNIVSVLDLARDGDDVFLVMEYVDGPSLRQLLRARGSRALPLGVATYIVQAAAAGLEFAHARPGGAVIHADISPSNLLLTTSGEVRVADFGIARREGNGAGVVEGKWAYMAPEQARGEALTPRSDVFALGVVLYELISGQHPLGQKVTANERGGEALKVTPPRVVKPAIPPGLDAICMRALAYDPRDRYARMQQLIDALVEERFTNGYREGANDLAQAIKEIAPAHGLAVVQSKTQVTDRPVTIVTRSLISQPARMSSPRIGEVASVSPRPSASTALAAPPPEPSPALSIPLRVDGTAAHIDLAEVRNHRWTFAVLGIAVVLGIVAAATIQLAPDDRVEPVAEASLPAPVPAAAPAPTVPTVTVPVVVPGPEPVAAAAPDPVPEQKPEPAPVADKHVVRKARTPASPKTPSATKASQVGWLKATTRDVWAFVEVNGDRREAPHTYALPPGRYKVKFVNDQFDIHKTCTATVASNSIEVIREDQCE